MERPPRLWEKIAFQGVKTRMDGSSGNHKANKLVMTLLVRDEEDIIRYNIDFHLCRGVDFIIATNNGSTDSTRNILREYEERGVLYLIDEKTQNYNQAQWNNHMTKIARDRYAADIIFHCDADEFWYPRSGNLKDEISNRPEDILNVDVVHILLEDKGGAEAFPEDTRFAVVNPIVAKNYIEETKDVNFFYFKYPSKVIFKPIKKILLVDQGNHTVTNKDDTITEGKSQDVVIYHYPVRSKAQFFQKVILGGSAYQTNTTLSKDAGFQTRRWYASYNNGLLDEEYKKLILPEGDVNNFLREGFIEEIDFNNVILGNEKDIPMWRYFNRKFEYEYMFQDFYWPWAGHKYFVYDLIRNFKPKVLVELGTHKGTSFFSFCQAVKDALYNARLYAVDTWQGDEHAGFYDDTVFKELEEIKEEYYGSLEINFLRKTFDEAVGEFKNNSIDILHIDGLHTYAAVKHDFETWFPKVKREGIILLHDIFINREDFEVYKFWKELKNDYKTIEFHQSYGLGVLFKDTVGNQSLIDKESEWQIRYSYIAEDKKNEETRKYLDEAKRSLAKNDRQIASLNMALTERDSRIATLDQALTERDGQIARLNITIAEYEGQIANLCQTLNDHNGERIGLEQALSERDSHISHLHLLVAEHENVIRQILSSTSWRLTRPLRALKTLFLTKVSLK